MTKYYQRYINSPKLEAIRQQVKQQVQMTLDLITSNYKFYHSIHRAGFEYLINPATDELHLVSPRHFGGSHNLSIADLQNFIPCKNVGIVQVHLFPNGVELPVFDLQTHKLRFTYSLNKCQHCFQ